MEKVSDSNEGVHESHGTKGHEEDLEVSERKYKKKRKKSKKKNKSLYPYVFNGYLDNDSTESDSLDFGGFNIEGE